MKTSFCQEFVPPFTPGFKYEIGPSKSTKPQTHRHPTSSIATTTASRTHYRTLFHQGGGAILSLFISCPYVPGRIHSLCFPFLETRHFLLCKHWSYASLRYPWLQRCKELLNYIPLVFQPLCLWGFAAAAKTVGLNQSLPRLTRRWH